MTLFQNKKSSGLNLFSDYTDFLNQCNKKGTFNKNQFKSIDTYICCKSRRKFNFLCKHQEMLNFSCMRLGGVVLLTKFPPTPSGFK